MVWINPLPGRGLTQQADTSGFRGPSKIVGMMDATGLARMSARMPRASGPLSQLLAWG